MRCAAILTLIAALDNATAAGTEPKAAAAGLRCAYFRVETSDARMRLAPYVTREFPGGMVSAALPPATVETLASVPGLVFIAYEGLFHPAPMETRLVEAPSSARAADGTTRPCTLPRFIQPVGWGVKAMYEDSTLLQTSGGAGIKVAVIDGGVAPHLDVVRRLAKCADFTPLDTPPCTDSTFHGTLVASIIAADGGFDGLGMWGMAPEASIYSYRVCEPNGECWGSYIAAGIYAAIADGVNIINLSLSGSGHDPVVRAAIDAAVDRNILVVVAAGNSPPFSYVGYPAVYPEVVCVGAIQPNLSPWTYTSAGINDGDYIREDSEIELAAPGASVLAALKTGCWVLGSGTSLAAPHVTGLAAKLWDGSADRVRERLRVSARFHDLYAAGDDTLTGLGLPTVGPAMSQFLFIEATSGVGGAIRPGGSVPVAPGSNVAFTIQPDSCHRIADVTVDGVSRGPISSHVFQGVASAHSIEATFAFTGPFTITASAGPGGAISSPGTQTVTCGSNRSFAITPWDCNKVQDVKVDGVSRGPMSSCWFYGVHASHTVQVTFEPLGPYPITATAGANGSISPGGVSYVACAGQLRYTIAPRLGCSSIEGVRVDGHTSGRITSFTFRNVREPHSIGATFTPNPVAVTASAGPGGTITPGGVTGVLCGGSLGFTIVPADSCHVIRDVKVDGVSRGPISILTLSDVASNRAIEASFTRRGLDRAPGGKIHPGGPTRAACGEDPGEAGTSETTGASADRTAAAASAGGDPVAMSLGRPSPNPTTGSLRFDYATPGGIAIRLSILDLEGREVALLAQGARPAGRAWATWNGETVRGRAAGGVYFACLQAGARRIVHRFALVR